MCGGPLRRNARIFLDAALRLASSFKLFFASPCLSVPIPAARHYTSGTKKRGTLQIEFYGEDDLADLMKLFEQEDD